jgi:hypothetical protein
MSSKYTTINLLINACNIWFIKCINIVGAFVSQNYMTNHSYKPYLVLNAVFHSSFFFIVIWWYPLFRLILEKMYDPCNSSSMSSNLGMRCLYFTIILLMTRQSTHTLHVLSFLGTSNIYTTHELKLSWMYLFSISSSTCLWSSFVFLGLLLYVVD